MINYELDSSVDFSKKKFKPGDHVYIVGRKSVHFLLGAHNSKIEDFRFYDNGVVKGWSLAHDRYVITVSKDYRKYDVLAIEDCLQVHHEQLTLF